MKINEQAIERSLKICLVDYRYHGRVKGYRTMRETFSIQSNPAEMNFCQLRRVRSNDPALFPKEMEGCSLCEGRLKVERKTNQGTLEPVSISEISALRL